MFKKYFIALILFSCLFAENPAWVGRNSKTGAEKAYQYYKKQYVQQKNYASAWQYARAAHFYADNFVADSDQKKNIFTEGKDAALEATKLSPDKPDGHYWLGANYGSWAEVNGILESLNYADDIAEEMTKVIKLDPAYKNGLPYAIRAKVYYKAPGWPLSVGDPKKAEEDFISAIKLAKGKNRKVYRFYAEYLISKDKQKALKITEEGLVIPYDNSDSVIEDKENSLLKELSR